LAVALLPHDVVADVERPGQAVVRHLPRRREVGNEVDRAGRVAHQAAVHVRGDREAVDEAHVGRVEGGTLARDGDADLALGVGAADRDEEHGEQGYESALEFQVGSPGTRNAASAFAVGDNETYDLTWPGEPPFPGSPPIRMCKQV